MARHRLDCQLLLAILLAAAVVIPRSVSIAVSHCESCDDEFHYSRGLVFVTGDASRKIVEEKLWFNDPPMGEALNALPVLVANVLYGRPATSTDFYAHPLGRETLAAAVAVWKSLLFLPMVGVVFAWCRSLYGTRSAWLATALLIVDPTLAAHIPTGAVDVLGVEGIVISCYLAWRFFDRSTMGRAAALGVSTAFALLIKHTAVILPPTYAAYACIEWGIRPWLERQGWIAWRVRVPSRLRLLAFAVLVAIASLWAFTGFDVSTPPLNYPAKTKTDFLGMKSLARRPWPAGIYAYSFLGAMMHSRGGHPGYLWGEHRQTGWWYYFPALMTYKIPIGVGLVILLGLSSLRAPRPSWGDCGVLIPWAALTLLLVTSKINIGFRHYLAPYVFLIVFSSRCVASPTRWRAMVAWVGVAVAALHAASFHPDYMSYINYPRNKPYLAITDSNIDWGQSVKEVGRWLDQHPQAGRAVYLSYFGVDQGAIKHYLKDRVTVVSPGELPEKLDVLIISPCNLVDDERFARLRAVDPDHVIGHGSMLVYELKRPDASSIEGTRSPGRAD